MASAVSKVLLVALFCAVPAPLSLSQSSSGDPPGVAKRKAEIANANVPGSKTVRLELGSPEDPVRIVKLLENDRDITATLPFGPTIGKPFVPAEGTDWLRDLSVVIKDFSNKEIVAGNLRVNFPETGDGSYGHPFVGVSVPFGSKPEQYSPDGTKIEGPSDAVPLNLAPGQEATIALKNNFDDIKAAVENNLPLTSITKCLIQLQYFYFADGTRWAPHNFQKPDPNHPGKYLQMTVDEFRSTTSAN